MFRWLALFGVIAACGDGLTVPDASVPPDANRGRVTVRVKSTRIGTGARVFFQQSDSQLVLATSTDPEGRAEAFIPPHSFVTVELTEFSEGELRRLYTQTDVNPGDEVVIDDGTLATSATVIVTVPVEPPGATFSVRAPCVVNQSGPLIANEPTPVTLTGCPPIASLSVQSDNTSDYLYRRDVVLSDGASVTFTGEYQPLESTTLRVENVPPNVRWLQAAQALLDHDRELWRLFDVNVFFDRFETSGETTMLTPTWANAQAITMLHAPNGTVSASNIYQWGPRGDTTTIDYGTDFVRPYLTQPYYSPSANLVGWIEGDRGRLADAVLISMNWQAQDLAQGRFASIQWSVFAQRREEAWVTMPVLPDLFLQPREPFVNGVTNFAIDGGYERLRKLPLLGQWPHFSTGISPQWPIDAPTGRVTFESLGSFGGEF